MNEIKPGEIVNCSWGYTIPYYEDMGKPVLQRCKTNLEDVTCVGYTDDNGQKQDMSAPLEFHDGRFFCQATGCIYSTSNQTP